MAVTCPPPRHPFFCDGDVSCDGACGGASPWLLLLLLMQGLQALHWLGQCLPDLHHDACDGVCEGVEAFAWSLLAHN